MKAAGRTDLIGFGPECLIRPDYSPRKKAPAKKAEEVVPEKPKKTEYKAGWAKPKPKKNARPVKKGGKKK